MAASCSGSSSHVIVHDGNSADGRGLKTFHAKREANAGGEAQDGEPARADETLAAARRRNVSPTYMVGCWPRPKMRPGWCLTCATGITLTILSAWFTMKSEME